MRRFAQLYPDGDRYMQQWILDNRYQLGMCKCGCGRQTKPPAIMTTSQGMAVAMATKGVY